MNATIKNYEDAVVNHFKRIYKATQIVYVITPEAFKEIINEYNALCEEFTPPSEFKYKGTHCDGATFDDRRAYE